ncbi:homeobox protein 6-like [Calliphora vicina]|uniref:homeobox protein 6-like n=1 Tax=Calliphora vicina TaxID=7373 RepID=UPI00325B5F7A
MYKELVFVCCAIALILVSTTEARGGRGGGGRSSGRSSSGRSSSGRGGGFFSSSSGSKSSSGRGGLFSSSSSGSGKSSSIGVKSGNSFSGGWFHGFFHSTPYRYTYRPTHIVHSSSSTNTGSYHIPTKEEEAEQNKETSDYAVGYTISKALSSDFFSIFNVVHDISKYPEKIRNKELLTTTTQSPVSSYDLNYIVNPPYTRTSTTYEVDPKSYFLDDDTLFGMMNSHNNLENNAGTSTESTATTVDENNENNAGTPSIVGNLHNIFEVTSTESSTAKDNTKSYYPDEGVYPLFGGMNFNTNNLFNDNIQKQLAEIQSSVAESTTMKTSLDITNESLYEMLKRMENSYGSLKIY